jgi:hypothetical protein
MFQVVNSSQAVGTGQSHQLRTYEVGNQGKWWRHQQERGLTNEQLTFTKDLVK